MSDILHLFVTTSQLIVLTLSIIQCGGKKRKEYAAQSVQKPVTIQKKPVISSSSSPGKKNSNDALNGSDSDTARKKLQQLRSNSADQLPKDGSKSGTQKGSDSKDNIQKASGSKDNEQKEEEVKEVSAVSKSEKKDADDKNLQKGPLIPDKNPKTDEKEQLSGCKADSQHSQMSQKSNISVDQM
ncbi:unnamed protein product [Bursaphelenchus okinawaensis]|uniref:Uncharacterized protein n=1 Tax=Bursaphelenchus okinawaensis TaxID=465554 RepID=A0A811LA90_9BILA|nr:unnamed protein product [Bursaphelenchus okinawaensis]CAG9119928.1 unnamed protein product [Bursaphelenchus okinawaensis]